MEPPYQRRSVWSQAFKDYFIDTVLLNYPAPAIFLYEEIAADGRSTYHVVDGKQRLTSLFEFISGEFPVGDKSECSSQIGRYFESLDDDTKRRIWGYQFLVEYIPTDDAKIINSIFDRINRNVAKLTAQELRHAKLDGEFITVAENLAEWMIDLLPKSFPRFGASSQKQMKDVEFVALLLLLLEDGPKSYSQNDLDDAFANRDQFWENKRQIENEFREIIRTINEIVTACEDQRAVTGSRLRNQADFYSLFGAISAQRRSGVRIRPEDAASRIAAFLRRVEDPAVRNADPELAQYYEAARSASNDKGPRERRIEYMASVLAS